MKLKFRTQAHQTAAVQAVVDCFRGQIPHHGGIRYRLDPGGQVIRSSGPHAELTLEGTTPADVVECDAALANADVTVSEAALLENIRAVQRSQGLPVSEALVRSRVARINLDIEMETGTGKTYCYIKTLFELNRQYGWSKFIIVVPSIAIREGVSKSLQMTADHFQETYHRKARFFTYNSKQLHQLESYSSDAGIHVVVINVQAFAARGADRRRIYEVLDDFQTRRPIDVISANRPILILDEPQKMEGAATLKSLEEFGALMVLRYSATHKSAHNRIHRLDALDAYQQKLVKKIAVCGISVQGAAGTAAYLYLQSIEISSTTSPRARVEFERRLADGTIGKTVRQLSKGDNLFALSNGLDQYRAGFVVADINANSDVLSLGNGVELTVGDVIGDVSEAALRRIQIREAIKAHLDKEQALYPQGVKVLTLFFIDEVVRYRDYSALDDKGEYARVFEEEYQRYLDALPDHPETPYGRYLKGIPADSTHSGYFAIDRQSRRAVDPVVVRCGASAGLSDDANAYDLILKDKERLLSLAEPVRFIFSHSALREGWDNPNVFVICALKHSDNTVSRRQEVGRGLRLCVNQQGERVDHPATVHEVNVLTVVASESYSEFVTALQKDISESLSARRSVTDAACFTGRLLKSASGNIEVTPQLAKQICSYLIRHGYADDMDGMTGAYEKDRQAGVLAALPPELAPYAGQLYRLIDRVVSDNRLPDIVDDRKPRHNPLNANFDRPEFREFWNLIRRKAAYRVEFDSNELVSRAIGALNDADAGLRVTPLHYTVQHGEQSASVSQVALGAGDAFELKATGTERSRDPIRSAVKYDLVGKLSEGTRLTRRTVTEILKGLDRAVFAQFRTNPESFIAVATRLINEQKATVIIEHLSYAPVDDGFGLDIFTAGQAKQDLSRAVRTPRRHIHDFMLPESGSNAEREFAQALESSADVVVYARLPRGFLISTPVGDYSPDWAISFRKGSVRHRHVVADTKGLISTTDLHEVEKMKIRCARRFFKAISGCCGNEHVKYGVVDSFGALMDIVN